MDVTYGETPGTQFLWRSPIPGMKGFASLSERATKTLEFISPKPQDGILHWAQAASKPGSFPLRWNSQGNSKLWQPCLTCITDVKCSAWPGEVSRSHFVLPEAFSAQPINPCNPFLIAWLHRWLRCLWAAWSLQSAATADARNPSLVPRAWGTLSLSLWVSGWKRDSWRCPSWPREIGRSFWAAQQ